MNQKPFPEIHQPATEIYQSTIVLCDSRKNLLVAAMREASETACKGGTPLFTPFKPDSDAKAAGADVPLEYL